MPVDTADCDRLPLHPWSIDRPVIAVDSNERKREQMSAIPLGASERTGDHQRCLFLDSSREISRHDRSVSLVRVRLVIRACRLASDRR